MLAATIYRRLEDAGVGRRQASPAVDRATLIAALAEGLAAPGIAGTTRRQRQRRLSGAPTRTTTGLTRVARRRSAAILDAPDRGGADG